MADYSERARRPNMAADEPVPRDGVAGHPARPLGWHHTSLAVTDIDLAIAFHRAAFGLDVVFEERGMSAQIASIAGVPGLVCDLVQMRYERADQVLEFIAFRPREGQGFDPEPVPVRPGSAH